MRQALHEAREIAPELVVVDVVEVALPLNLDDLHPEPAPHGLGHRRARLGGCGQGLCEILEGERCLVGGARAMEGRAKARDGIGDAA